MLFVGVTHSDDHATVDQLAGKCAHLRIFKDENQCHHQCSALDLKLEARVVSQFSLYGNTNKGRRPGFELSARPEKAEKLYEVFIQSLADRGIRTSIGKFRAEMQVNLTNDGPVTYMLEKDA